MSERHRGDAAFRLRSFARIVDDERIDQRQRSEDGARRASLAAGDGLARQPFERAVGAEMNERVDLRDVAQPQIERDVAVSRRRRRIVILRLAIVRLSALRLQPDDEIAEAHGAK